MTEQEQKAFAREYFDAVNAVEAAQRNLDFQQANLMRLRDIFAKLRVRDQYQVDHMVQLLKLQ